MARERHQECDERAGFWPRVVERPRNKLEAISAARAAFSRCQFDEQSCDLGLKRLRAYRKEWDEGRGVWKDRPRHDESSHGADAFLTFPWQRLQATHSNAASETRLELDPVAVAEARQPLGRAFVQGAS